VKLASSSNPWWGLWRKLELELLYQEFLVGIQLSMAAENESASIRGGEVNVNHLDRGKLIEDSSGSKPTGQGLESCT